MAVGVTMVCVAGCLFFLVGTLVPGGWWLLGIPFAAVGMICILYSDKMNGGKQKRAEEKQARSEGIKDMKKDLYERLERDRRVREEMLRNIYGKGE